MPKLFSSDNRSGSAGALASFLLGAAAFVVLILTVGGITRLTESGLSITEWDVVSGILPPLTNSEWQEAFEKYQQIPEFVEINGPAGMTLSDFKSIFFWEWLHRILGRLLGIYLAAGFAWFALRRRIPSGYGLRLFALFALLCAQGALGWYMVQSGLSERTDVSHFRLSAHLITALILLGGLIWTALDLRNLGSAPARLKMSAWPVLIILLIQLVLGAWVAGLDAGYVARDWPLMQGRFFPAGVNWDEGTLFAFTHDPFLIHFMHRWWAWVAVAALIWLARRVKKAGGRRISIAIHTTFGTQILLGIATVMSGMVLWLAALHQLVGALVFAATVWGIHFLGRRSRRTVR